MKQSRRAKRTRLTQKRKTFLEILELLPKTSQFMQTDYVLGNFAAFEKLLEDIHES